jgi:D-alanyl-D-alanine carboxypeptidase
MRVVEENDEFEEIDEDVPALPSTEKITVTQRRHTTIYEPPVTSPHPTRGRRSRSRPQRNTTAPGWQDFAQRHSLLLVGLAVVLLLLIAPLVAPTALNDFRASRNTITILGGQGQTDTTGKNANNSSTDPHHLVIVPPANNDHPAPPVYATSAYLLDADTGTTLYATNPFMHLPMLSTTKLMTALIAAEEGNPEQKITITNAIAGDINNLSADSSLMGIKRGETYTLRELLYGLLLVSGNDAAVAIADGLAGNQAAFVAKMNQRALQLGLHDTHYMNPHGLLAQGHYSSAHDLALLGKYSFSNPLLRQISGTRTYTLTKTATHAAHDLINGNQFLWWYPGVDAGKPGWDGANNFNQVISCIRNNHHLIGVVMHTKDWWTDMRDLMNWGFNTFQWISPATIDMQSAIPFDADWNFFARDKKENTIPTADKGRYYIYTGYSISNPILTYFDKGGGLKKFGYPTSPPKKMADTTIKQQFEHAAIQCDTQTRQCSTI